MKHGAGVIIFCLSWTAGGGPAQGLIQPSEVLVVYNSQSSGSIVVKNAYLAVHPDIPAANSLDLNDVSIADTADISYATFVSRIRDPIRAYLDLPAGPSPSSIASIVLIRGIPHRIQDTDAPTAGDDPPSLSSEFSNGDATAASVDAEIVLLWQDLDTGEAGGAMDSKSDNAIVNPYHRRTVGIQSFARSNIKVAKTFDRAAGVAWRLGGSGSTGLTPGDMYLVSRIDGNSIPDTLAMIDRARDLVVNRRYGWIILDEDSRSDQLDDDAFSPFPASADYENTRDRMEAAGWQVRYDARADFIEPSEHPRPIVAYASYGENHGNYSGSSDQSPPGAGTYISGFAFAPGAVFNTIESYSGRAFNGLGTRYSQEQAADFIAAGGTFAVGHVWEPFSFSIADNEFLVTNLFLNGLCWGEAAWSAIPALSWMNIVIGDPLARVTAVVNRATDFDADGDVDSTDFEYLDSCATGPQRGPLRTWCDDADVDGDGHVDQRDFAIWQRCRGTSGSSLDEICED